MELDPRIIAIIGCGILMFAGVSIPDKTDVAKQLKTDLEELYRGYDWCGENEQCKKTAQISIRALDISLSAVEMHNNIRLLLFWGGLLGAGGSLVSFVKN